jgi:hypothetical protein
MEARTVEPVDGCRPSLRFLMRAEGSKTGVAESTVRSLQRLRQAEEKTNGIGLRLQLGLQWAEVKLNERQAYGTDLGRRDDRSGSVALWRNGQAELLRRTCLIQTQDNTQDCGENVA